MDQLQIPFKHWQSKNSLNFHWKYYSHHRMEKLFSYGILQQEEVQLANFGRKLTGAKDALVGYKISTLKITDRTTPETSGKEFDPIVRHTGNSDNFVEGTVFEVTQQEILKEDHYKAGDYQRLFAPLRSGESAWVYIKLEEKQ